MPVVAPLNRIILVMASSLGQANADQAATRSLYIVSLPDISNACMYKYLLYQHQHMTVLNLHWNASVHSLIGR